MTATRYEYDKPQRLSCNCGAYIRMPSSVILDADISHRRASVFSFFSARRGLDRMVIFSLNEIAKWTGRTPDRGKTGANNNVRQIIKLFEDAGYIETLGDPKDGVHTSAIFNTDKVSDECNVDRFAIIYIDELQKIFAYRNLNKKDTKTCNNDALLLVFSYIRMMIAARRNKLFPEEANCDIDMLRMKTPEAYNCYQKEIANDLGMSEKIISNAIKILNDLELIYSEPLKRAKYDDKWHTNHTLFCNRYKREGAYLLDDGEGYYLREIKNKKDKLNRLRGIGKSKQDDK